MRVRLVDQNGYGIPGRFEDDDGLGPVSVGDVIVVKAPGKPWGKPLERTTIRARVLETQRGRTPMTAVALDTAEQSAGSV